METRLKQMEERLDEMEAQIQMLTMATQTGFPSGGQSHLGKVMLSMGLNAREWHGYYRFLGEAIQMPINNVVEAFQHHLPHRGPEQLLDIGVALYLDLGSPISKRFMEAALRAMRERETG
jgi:hypothetical protein